MDAKGLSRRQFLRWLVPLTGVIGSGAFWGALSGCQQPQASTVATKPVSTDTPGSMPTPVPSSTTTKPSSTAATVALTSTPAAPMSTSSSQLTLVVVKGGTPQSLVRAAMDAMGGMGRFVKKGQWVVIKPNIGFAMEPEYAATTNPELLVMLIKLCQEAGARSVEVFDNPVASLNTAYQVSGIEEAVKSAGAQMVRMSRLKFKDTPIPRGKAIRSWLIYEDALNADVLINVPIAKHHNLAGLTLAMKNLMGVCGSNRGGFHQSIGQCLADVATVVPVSLTVIDAVRILTRNGPTGGNLADVKKLDTIIVSTDMVAADSYAATLFGLKGTDLSYVTTGLEMGLGQADYRKLPMREVQL